MNETRLLEEGEGHAATEKEEYNNYRSRRIQLSRDWEGEERTHTNTLARRDARQEDHDDDCYDDDESDRGAIFVRGTMVSWLVGKSKISCQDIYLEGWLPVPENPSVVV